MKERLYGVAPVEEEGGKERGLGGVALDCDAAWRKSQLG